MPGSGLVFYDLNHVLNLGNHATDSRRIFQLTLATDLVQTKADQRSTLVILATDRATGVEQARAGLSVEPVSVRHRDHAGPSAAGLALRTEPAHAGLRGLPCPVSRCGRAD